MDNYRRTTTILQMESAECGAASLGMILKFYGKDVPLEELREAVGVSRNGSSAKNIVLAAKKYGLKVRAYRKEVSDLDNIRTPAIMYWGFNHFVVFEGKKKGIYYINDPAFGKRKISEEEMDEFFTGVIILFAPDGWTPKWHREKSFLEVAIERMRGEYSAMIHLLLIGICLMVPGFLVPAVSQIFVDEVLSMGHYDWILYCLLTIAFVIISRSVLIYCRYSILKFLRMKVSLFSVYNFLDKMIDLPISFFEQRMAGELANRVKSNNEVNNFFTSEFAEAVLNLITALAYLALMFYYVPWMAIIVVLMKSVSVAVSRKIENDVSDYARRWQNDASNILGILNNSISIIDSLKAAGAESVYLKRILGHSAVTGRDEGKMAKGRSYLESLPSLFDAICKVVVLALGAMQVIVGVFPMGYLVGFVLLMDGFSEPFLELIQLSNKVELYKFDIDRVDDILNYKSSSKKAVNKVIDMPKERLLGYVWLKDLSFAYISLGEPFIKNLNLKIKAGSSIALVGKSGCGKSTIGKLINGLYSPWYGGVYVDGVLLQKIPDDIRFVSIATVSQEIALFPGTIWDNLTLWNSEISDEDVMSATYDACIHEEISAKPGAYMYELSEGGKNLSGGQRQRLEIARALTTNPSILIMDEATSALDPVVEEQIMENIKRRGCTCIMVAHRLSTIRDCDMIVVMEHGQIMETGTHDELMKMNGRYKTLVTADGGNS